MKNNCWQVCVEMDKCTDCNRGIVTDVSGEACFTCRNSICSECMFPCFQCGDILCDKCYVFVEYDPDLCIKCREFNHNQEVERLHRKNVLKQELRKNGLKLDINDKRCSNYIQTGNDDVYFIVENLCQKKFLVEYYDLDNKAKRIHENCSMLSFKECVQMVELEAFKEQIYPDIWPWPNDMVNKAARIIQQGCHNWLYKPVTADGKYGINMRIGMKMFGGDGRCAL